MVLHKRSLKLKPSTDSESVPLTASEWCLESLRLYSPAVLRALAAAPHASLLIVGSMHAASLPQPAAVGWMASAIRPASMERPRMNRRPQSRNTTLPFDLLANALQHGGGAAAAAGGSAAQRGSALQAVGLPTATSCPCMRDAARPTRMLAIYKQSTVALLQPARDSVSLELGVDAGNGLGVV